MQTPYLVLSDKAQELIAEMKKRHPALVIRVSTNSFASTDNLAAYSANYRLRNTYIEQLQLEVHEFKPKPASLMQLFPQYNLMAGARPACAGRRALPPPFLSLHAKSLVVDDRLAFIGSYNLDPRSENLNTEAGVIVEDAAFARSLREEIDRDMRAENSWVIARRQMPLGLDDDAERRDRRHHLAHAGRPPGRSRTRSSFELKTGAAEVGPDDPAFHECYRECGSFPGTEEPLSNKEILTRLFKVVGTPITPCCGGRERSLAAPIRRSRILRLAGTRALQSECSRCARPWAQHQDCNPYGRASLRPAGERDVACCSRGRR